MSNSLVSVIVPVYNPGEKFKKCLHAIDEQGYSNLEIILVDDGSTDGSEKVCDEYLKKQTKARVIHQKNQGSSAARNRGIKESTGEYIVFIDADDTIEQDFIGILVKEIKKEKICLAICNIERKINNSKKSEKKYSNKSFKIENRKKEILSNLLVDGKFYPVVNKIFDAKIIRENNINFNEKINFSEDLNFVLQYLEKCNGEIKYSSKSLYVYDLDLEKGTVGKSSREWKNWKSSIAFLKQWSNRDEKNIKCKTLLFLIKIRWFVSFVKAKIR